MFLITATCASVNDHLWKLLIMVECCRRAPPPESTPVILV